MNRLVLAIRRSLDLEPPEGGLCSFVRETEVREETRSDWTEYRKVMRCRRVWHHDGPHNGTIERLPS